MLVKLVCVLHESMYICIVVGDCVFMCVQVWYVCMLMQMFNLNIQLQFLYCTLFTPEIEVRWFKL